MFAGRHSASIYTGQKQLCFKTVYALEVHVGVMPNGACPMVLQVIAQIRQQMQQPESRFHETNLREEITHIVRSYRRKHAHLRRHDTLNKDLATEKQQLGNTQQQLSALRQDNLHLINKVKVRLCCLILLPVLCQYRRFGKPFQHLCCKLAMFLPAKRGCPKRKACNAHIVVAYCNVCVADRCYCTPCHSDSKLLLCPAQTSSPVGHNF